MDSNTWQHNVEKWYEVDTETYTKVIAEAKDRLDFSLETLRRNSDINLLFISIGNPVIAGLILLLDSASISETLYIAIWSLLCISTILLFINMRGEAQSVKGITPSLLFDKQIIQIDKWTSQRLDLAILQDIEQKIRHNTEINRPIVRLFRWSVALNALCLLLISLTFFF